MARLAAKEKMLYYPTDLETTRLIAAKHIRIGATYQIAPTYILDPCAGEGQAVRKFAETFREESFENSRRNTTYQSERDSFAACREKIYVKGVELDLQRADAAKELLGNGNVLQSAIEHVAVVGKFNILFCNPPYDYANSTRTELVWVDMVSPFLGESGLMILIVPDMFVDKGNYASDMKKALARNRFTRSVVLRFPDESYPQFKQVAIFAEKPYNNNQYNNYWHGLETTGVIGKSNWTYIFTPRNLGVPTITQTVKGEIRPSAFDPYPASIIDLVGDPTGKTNAMRPLMPMRSEHAAMVAAAGMFNGAIVGGKALKGSTIKRVVRHVEQSQTGKSTVTEVTEAEVLAAQLSTIDMSTGELAVVNSIDHKDEFEPMLEKHAQEFVDLAQRLYPPFFERKDTEQYRKVLSQIHAPRRIRGRQNGLFEEQIFRAAGILDEWRRNKVVTMNGEMGVGKTVVSMAACTIKAMQRKEHNRKIVVLLPPKADLVTKWTEEIKLALREFNPCVVHAETISNVQAAFAQNGLVFILLKETTAKMSSGWKPVQPISRKQPKKADKFLQPRCPTCGRPMEYNNEDPEKVKSHCANEKCRDSAMWTVSRRKTGNGDGPGYARYPLARFIRDRYRDRYILIVDEAHNMKAADSARAYAAQDLLASSHCAIQMTGTLYNGMASSIYYLLWRALPEFRKVWGWDDVQRFINQYGLFETVTRTYDRDSQTTASGYKDFNERKSEKPGIHPAMIAQLLPSTVFFGIRDLEVILPSYAEHTLFVPKPEKFAWIDSYLNTVRSDAVEKMMKHGDYSLLAQLTWAKQGAWDMASQGDYVDGHSLAPLECPWEMWPKEEALLRLIAQEKRAKRPVLCFVGQINRRDVTGRLCELLKRYGMKGAVMRANEKARVEFVRNAIRHDVDVIFTSAALVKEGIDLIELPTFVWLYGESNTYLVQQANRRAWRPGQELPCDIYYMAYNETPQAERMDRLAKKLGAAQTLQGDVRQGLAKLLGEEDFVSRLQDATISTEHFESDMTIDDLPELVPFEVAAAPQTPQINVNVIVNAPLAKSVRVRVPVYVNKENIQQLSLF